MTALKMAIDVAAINDTALQYDKQIMVLPKHEVLSVLKQFGARLGVKDSVQIHELQDKFGNSKKYTGVFAGGEIGAIVPRTLKVRPIVFELADEPEKLRETFLNEIGVGKVLDTTPFELWLIQRGLENASEDLFNALAIAKYDAESDEITDSFDGFLTIIDTEIEEGNIAAGKGNYYDPEAAITASNAGDKLKAMWRSAHKLLKSKGGIMYMSINMAEKYDDWYFANHDAWPNVDQSGQKFLEGSNGKCQIVPLACIPDENDQVILTYEGNITYGTESINDMKALKAFNSGNPYLFTATMKYVFGLQFASIHERVFKVSKSYVSES